MNIKRYVAGVAAVLVLFGQAVPFAGAAGTSSKINEPSPKQKLSQEFSVREEFVQKELNKGYRIAEVRQGLEMSKKGKSYDKAMAELRPASAPRQEKSLKVVKDKPMTKEQEQAKIAAMQAAVTTSSGVAPATVPDLNTVYDQAPFAVGSGENKISLLTSSSVLSNTDLVLKGHNGLDFALTRTYDSDASQIWDADYADITKPKDPYEDRLFGLGLGWRWAIPSVEKKTSTAAPILHLPGGNAYTMTKLSDGTYRVTGYQWSDIVFNTVTSVDTGNTAGYKYMSANDHITYFFNSAGNLTTIKDMLGNTVRFTYSDVTMRGATSKKITRIESSAQNFIDITYTDLETKMTMGSPNSSVRQAVTYRFLSDETLVSGNVEKTFYYLSEVEDPIQRKTQYRYELKDAHTGSVAGTFIINPYLLVKSVTHPTGSVSVYTYEMGPTRYAVNKGLNDIYIVTRVADYLPEDIEQKTPYNHVQLKSDGDMYRLSPDDTTFWRTVTDDLGHEKVYKYKPDTYSSIPFSKLVTTVEKFENTTETVSYTYDETTKKYDLPLQVRREIRNADGQVQSLTKSQTYDAFKNIMTQTDETGGTVSNTYDLTYHWLTKSRVYLKGSATNTAGAQYKETTFNYKSPANTYTGKVYSMEVKDQTAASLQLVNYSFDAKGNMTQKDIVETDRTITSQVTYDSLGLFPASETTNMTDPYGSVTQVTQRFAVDPVLGKATSVTDGRGLTTHYTYDGIGRVKQVTAPDTTKTVLNYDDSLNTVEKRVIDENGSIVERTINKWNPLGWKYESGLYRKGDDDTTYEAKAKSTFDKYGRVEEEEDAVGRTIDYTLDLRGRQTSILYTDGSVQKVDYDDANLKVKTTDPDQNTQIKTVDANGRTLKAEVVTPFGSQLVESYDYDYTGNVLKKSDGKNQAFTYVYDALSRLTSVTDPLNQTTRYEYDKRGNRTRTVLPDGQSIHEFYDEAGALTQRVAGERNGHPEFLNFYDENHNLIRQIDSKAKSTYFTYNNRNLMDSKEADGETISLQYDALGRRIQMTQTTGTESLVTGYQFNPEGWMAQIDLPDGKTIAYSYDLNGNRTMMKDPFDREIHYQHDNRDRITVVSLGSTTEPAEVAYTYTPGGMLDTETQKNGVMLDFSYDPQNRIAGIAGSDNNAAALPSFAYSYDQNGNMKSKTEHGATYDFTYDAVNRVKTSTQQNEIYAYDGNGNRTLEGKDQISLPKDAAFEYDAWNQLKKVTTQDGKVITYKYNGDGMLYERTLDGVTTRFYYDQKKLIAEANVIDGNATLSVRYIRGMDVVAQENEAGDKAYYLTNGHGDITEIRDSAGQVKNTYRYDIWGNVLESEEQIGNSLGYSGEYWDQEASLQYLRNRWYDPSQARFLSIDTYVGDPDDPSSLNRYTYVSNNPLTYVDPTGHWQQGDDRFSDAIQSELRYLTSLHEKAATDAKGQIAKAANKLRQIGDNGARYAVIRMNAFIPYDRVSDPRNSIPMAGINITHSGDDRGFNVHSTRSRLTQYVVVNLDNGESVTANYVGQTHMYDHNAKKDFSATASNSRMSSSVTQVDKKTLVHLRVEVANPLVPGAADIDWDIYLVIHPDGSVNATGWSDIFPSYEGYTSINGSGYKSFYQRSASPKGLPGLFIPADL